MGPTKFPLFRTDFSDNQKYNSLKQKLFEPLGRRNDFPLSPCGISMDFIEDREWEGKDYEYIKDIGYFAVVDNRSMKDSTIAVVDWPDITRNVRFRVI
jgi:hypothetical protein